MSLRLPTDLYEWLVDQAAEATKQRGKRVTVTDAVLHCVRRERTRTNWKRA